MSTAQSRVYDTSYDTYRRALLPSLVVVVIVLVVIIITRILQSETMQGIGLLALQRANRAFKLSDVRGVQESTKQFGASQDEDQAEDEDYEGRRDLTYPGLLNTSTTCYLNSTLQSLASCPSFISYLNSLVKSSDVHLELTLSLLQMLRALNRPFKNGLVLKTNEILYSLMNSSSTGHAYKNRRRIMQGSGQQDAQEFFLILAETVEEEKKVLYKRVEEVRQEKVGLQELLLPIEILEIISRVVGSMKRHTAAANATLTYFMNRAMMALYEILSSH